MNEEVLATLEAYLTEIGRRKTRTLRAQQLEAFLDRQLPGLSTDERREVVRATMTYEDALRRARREFEYETNEEAPPSAGFQAAMEQLYEEYRGQLIACVGQGATSQILAAEMVSPPRPSSSDGR